MQLGIVALLIAAVYPALGQKVKVGYDKSADFSKYKTYTRAEPSVPVLRPLVYQSIVDEIDLQLQSKNLAKTDTNPDLILIPAGGVGFGINNAAATPILPSYSGPPPAVDATMWTGAGGPSNLMAQYVAQGTLTLTFVDRNTHKIVWSGTVGEKLDPQFERNHKSWKKIDKAIMKLLAEFPPKK